MWKCWIRLFSGLWQNPLLFCPNIISKFDINKGNIVVWFNLLSIFGDSAIFTIEKSSGHTSVEYNVINWNLLFQQYQETFLPATLDNATRNTLRAYITSTFAEVAWVLIRVKCPISDKNEFSQLQVFNAVPLWLRTYNLYWFGADEGEPSKTTNFKHSIMKCCVAPTGFWFWWYIGT